MINVSENGSKICNKVIVTKMDRKEVLLKEVMAQLEDENKKLDSVINQMVQLDQLELL
jgi:hypothetical protein